jgi:hypothetical protein
MFSVRPSFIVFPMQLTLQMISLAFWTISITLLGFVKFILPFVGLGAWALDMPFMQRYNKAFLQGKDIETTKKSCGLAKKRYITQLKETN